MGKILHMVSGPRNMSTAIMYAFDNRSDTLGVDEPFYANYLNRYPDVDHPGRNEILQSQSTDANKVISQLQRKAKDVDYLFIKNMAHHIEQFDLNWLQDVKHLFLIRDPQKLINSFAKVIENPTIKDIGIKDEYLLFRQLTERGISPLVLDSGDLINDPREVIVKLCEALDIEFSEEMLSWKAGPREIDGVWAPYWYTNVHKTTGFKQQLTSRESMPDRYQSLLDEAMPYYQSLYEYAIK